MAAVHDRAQAAMLELRRAVRLLRDADPNIEEGQSLFRNAPHRRSGVVPASEARI